MLLYQPWRSPGRPPGIPRELACPRGMLGRSIVPGQDNLRAYDASITMEARIEPALARRVSRRLAQQCCSGDSCSSHSNYGHPGREDGGVGPQIVMSWPYWSPEHVPGACQRPGDAGRCSGRPSWLVQNHYKNLKNEKKLKKTKNN